MNEENTLLNSMLKEKKITPNDYHMISDALNKNSFCREIESSVFLNPFQKIAGLKALMLGVLIMILMSFIGTAGKLYFDGALSASTAADIKSNYPPSFFLLLYQNLMTVVPLSLLFLFFSKLFGKKKIRIIDFFGTVAFSRFPYLFLATLLWFMQAIDPTLFTSASSYPFKLHFNIMLALVSFFWGLGYWWQLLTYFFALRVSSGLDGKQLWIAFVISILAGDFISMHLGRIFLYM